MITTGRLEEICKAINREYGRDCPVCIQFLDNGALTQGYYAIGFRNSPSGTLYLMNEPFKCGNCDERREYKYNE